MKKYFEQSGSKLKHQKPQPQHWTNFSLGKSNVYMVVVASVRDNFNRIELNIKGSDAKNTFYQLKNKYEDESLTEIDESLVWDELEGRMMSWVYLTRNANISDRSDWADQFKWIMETCEKMDVFFRPRIRSLQ